MLLTERTADTYGNCFFPRLCDLRVLRGEKYELHLQHVAYRNYKVLDWIFLAVTGFVAYHALTHRNEDGENDTGHMLFGAIALLFFARVLLVDLLKIW